MQEDVLKDDAQDEESEEDRTEQNDAMPGTSRCEHQRLLRDDLREEVGADALELNIFDVPMNELVSGVAIDKKPSRWSVSFAGEGGRRPDEGRVVSLLLCQVFTATWDISLMCQSRLPRARPEV